MNVLLFKQMLNRDRKFYGNLVALGVVQATNFIIPLLTFPYLIRTIGLEKFGVVSYGLSVMTYLNVIVDFGFIVSATRSVTLVKNDSQRLSDLYSSVTWTKLFLFILSTIIILLLTVFSDRFNKDQPLYFFSTIFVLGIAMMPTWLYQGMEQMRHITYINFATKIILIGALFTAVTKEEDYIYVIGIYGVANLITGLYGNWQAIRLYQIRLFFPKLSQIKQQLSQGLNIFITNLVIVLLNSSNLLILAFFVNDKALGSYGLSEKIVIALWQVLTVFSQAIYPVLCRLAQNSHEQLKQFIARTFLPFALGIFIVCLVIYIKAEYIVRFLTGHIDPEAVRVLKIMIWVPFAVCLNIPAYQTQLAYSVTGTNTKLYAIAAVINLALCSFLSYTWGAIGAAIAMICAQLIVTIGLYVITEYNFKQYSVLR
ncbi:Putative O-antigen transporter [Fibrisoma limi BUZ 3]|uniref:Putative O-antigen transporter n=1 Tax=Fibrisoma limi BUZ 3 TaxID=1185876 RepID=I2GSU3_9BACT|nr:oligosaccharide flippase family protein [Fibrisoma limi]CCH56972.1 Putative O-antigen transporter [Fibrisoma limi BUZ 3]